MSAVAETRRAATTTRAAMNERGRSGGRPLSAVFPRMFDPRTGGPLSLNPFQARVLAKFREGYREVWAIGGNQSGKTTLGALWSIGGALSDDVGEVSWCCCRDSEAQREAPQPTLTAFLADHEIARDRYGRRMKFENMGKIDRIHCAAGGRGAGILQFHNYADGPERGPRIKRAWLDELTGEKSRDQEYYVEVRRGLMASGGRLLATLTAVRGMTPLMRHILKERRDIAVVTGTTYENEHNLAAGAIAQFTEGMSEWEIATRIGGRVLPMGGRPFLSGDVLMRLAVAAPLRIEMIAGVAVHIYEEPETDADYTIGGDAAEGLGRDHGSLTVNRVGHQEASREVAAVDQDCSPDVLGEVMATLALRYRGRARTALAVPEANGPGLVVIERLIARGVRLIARPNMPDTVPSDALSRWGFRTTATSRPVLLNTLERAIKRGDYVPRSEAAIESLRTFVWGARRPEAAEGFVDDPVFSSALAVYGEDLVPAPPAVTAPPPRQRPRNAAEHLARLRAERARD